MNLREASAFNFCTVGTAMEKAKMEASDILDGIIHRATTILYGPSGCGKSRLIAEIVTAAVTGTPWAGHEWKRNIERVAIVTTDFDAHREYGEYIGRAGLSDRFRDAIGLYELELSPSASRWDALSREVLAFDPGLAIFDNGTDMINGSVNDDEAVSDLFRQLSRFRPIPILVAGHTAKLTAGDTDRRNRSPLGSVTWENRSRSKLYLRQSYAKEDGDLTMEVRPRESAAFEIHLRQQDDGRLVFESTTSDADIKAEKSRKRADTRARDFAIAEDVTAHCLGMSKVDVARYVAERHPEVTKARDKVGQIQTLISRGRHFASTLEWDDGRLIAA